MRQREQEEGYFIKAARAGGKEREKGKERKEMERERERERESESVSERKRRSELARNRGGEKAKEKLRA
eukprot:4797928-Pleurochrysis_carterae.AAC.1